jgi:4-diphosphocytidyl-2-C-methyl-D-erythritol kinase
VSDSTTTGLGGGARTIAPGKLNATLLVGPVRPEDGRHELTSVMQSLSLADDVALVPAPKGSAGDLVDCPGVSGDNLALDALRAFRAATGWSPPPLTVRIVKRIPVAAGMAGGSTDAAAVLRLAAHLSGHSDPALLQELAEGLGADVPHGLEPGLALAAGAGERLVRIDGVLPGAVVVLRAAVGLSTPSVFRRADELHPPRTAEDLEAWRLRVVAALDAVAAVSGGAAPARSGSGASTGPSPDRPPTAPSYPAELAVNDLGAAAVDLAPVVGEHLAALTAVGASPALVCGSGPTTVGWFPDEAVATTAADRLRADGFDALVARPSAGAPIETVPA